MLTDGHPTVLRVRIIPHAGAKHETCLPARTDPPRTGSPRQSGDTLPQVLILRSVSKLLPELLPRPRSGAQVILEQARILFTQLVDALLRVSENLFTRFTTRNDLPLNPDAFRSLSDLPLQSRFKIKQRIKLLSREETAEEHPFMR